MKNFSYYLEMVQDEIGSKKIPDMLTAVEGLLNDVKQKEDNIFAIVHWLLLKIKENNSIITDETLIALSDNLGEEGTEAQQKLEEALLHFSKDEITADEIKADEKMFLKYKKASIKLRRYLSNEDNRAKILKRLQE